MKKNLLLPILLLVLTFNKSFALDITTFPKERIVVNERMLTVYVAKDAKKREQGLSNVKLNTLKANGVDGMLFVFEDDGEKLFQAWYMNFDLLLLGLERLANNKFKVLERKTLNIGTTVNIKGRYVLELPLTENSLIKGR